MLSAYLWIVMRHQPLSRGAGLMTGAWRFAVAVVVVVHASIIRYLNGGRGTWGVENRLLCVCLSMLSSRVAVLRCRDWHIDLRRSPPIADHFISHHHREPRAFWARLCPRIFQSLIVLSVLACVSVFPCLMRSSSSHSNKFTRRCGNMSVYIHVSASRSYSSVALTRTRVRANRRDHISRFGMYICVLLKFAYDEHVSVTVTTTHNDRQTYATTKTNGLGLLALIECSIFMPICLRTVHNPRIVHATNVRTRKREYLYLCVFVGGGTDFIGRLSFFRLGTQRGVVKCASRAARERKRTQNHMLPLLNRRQARQSCA